MLDKYLLQLVDASDLAQHSNNINFTYLANNFDGNILRSPMDCIPLAVGGGSHHPHLMASSNTVNVTVASAAVAAGSGYTHHPHLNANPLHQHHHLLSHNTAYANSYALHHGVGSGNHHHTHSEQTKSLQELQHEVGALLEFRDLVIETFPDLKQKMASMSSAASTTSNTGGLTNGGQSVGSVISAAGSTATLTSGGTLVSRREWEPGIRIKRKISQKETNQPAATELSSSSLTRSRSNSHSGKKEPKSSSGGGGSANGGNGENNNGSVIQDSGFSTETSSSKEGHSASSTNGALTGAIASNRLSCPESDDELLNLLDVIHRKSNRLREEVEHLQNYERQQLRQQTACSNSEDQLDTNEGAAGMSKSSSSSANTALTPKTFREHVERLNKEDIKQLRKERDRLLDKLAEMEAETLTGRIKAAKMNDQVEELINVKKELEEQLKLAMAQKLELSSRIQQLQQQQQSKTPIRLSHSERSSQVTGLCSSSNTVVSSTISTISQPQTDFVRSKQQNTFQPVVVDNQQQQQQTLPFSSPPGDSHRNLFPFHQSSDTAIKRNQQQPQQFSVDQLGRLDGIISAPGSRANKCRVTDSKRFAAILLETSVIELQRQLLTLTVQNQVLTQKLEQASKSKSYLVKRLDKTKDDVEDLRFQLEEKNIELEGTKAQLRVLESRLHSTTSNSGAGINSYLHSHQDYETNRSSASTTLMMSRRDGSDIRSPTPLISSCGQMPQPITTQISTPSMKAMVPLPMDELQHNSSSTESAHDHELQLDASNKGIQRDAGGVGVLSISVGGVSSFEKQQQEEQKQQHQQQITALRNQVQALKKFSGGTTKPSKIPLAGSKAAAYFAGKPPTGRPSTAGRSPPSANSSTSSNRSPLSRSTGNLLYSKSPNSLKRTDSAQSIRKDNNHNSSSFSTNTSRSSTSSSIPLATTPYGSTPKSTISSYNTNNNNNSPSSRVLQNSPLPKPKRESLSTRVKHMDSLSRAYNNHLQQNHSNNNDSSNATTTVVATSTIPTTGVDKVAGSVSSSSSSSTPKTKTVTSQLTSSMRKDLQLSSSSFSHGSQAFPRRTIGITFGNTNPATTRRFSSASVVGARMVAARQAETDLLQNNSNNISGGGSTNTAAGAQASSSTSNGHGGANSGGGGGGNGTASDSDSGKSFSFDRNYGYLERDENPFEKSGLNKYFEKDLLNLTTTTTTETKDNHQPELKSNKITLSQYFEKELVDNCGHCLRGVTDERYIKKNNEKESLLIYEDDIECDKGSDELDFYTSYASYMNSSEDPGSDTVLVTFDYGFSDSLEDNDIKMNFTPFATTTNNHRMTTCEKEPHTDLIKDDRLMYRIKEENFIINDEKRKYYENDLLFKVNHMHHNNNNNNNYEEVNNSILSSLEEYNVDTSGDYGSWQQSTEDDDSNSNCSFNKYNYEDLIKREICETYEKEDGKQQHLFYYNSLDYLN
uniref:Uncharacterized protein n=1 Tax=Glossina brevipalpis TaxID=37001 RepID=A0A1A9WU60_9MUSC